MADRMVFVSCGQLTEEERQLGRDIARAIEAHGMQAFIAQYVHSTNDLNSNVFEAIRTCDAFVGILQKRGTVTFADHRPVERSSVWIQQEVAIFSYRMYLEGHQLPIRIYAESGVHREGVMDIAMMNPRPFEAPNEIIADVNAWLEGPAFAVDPVLSRREELFRRRINQLTDDALLSLEIIAAHCPDVGDWARFDHVARDFLDAIG